MNRCLLRWILVILMGLALALLLSSPYMAEAELVVESGTLSMNILEGGVPPKEENWTFQPDLEDETITHPQSYRDSTIEVTFEQDFITHRLVSGPHKGSRQTDEAWVVRIKINHPSQLRTAFSLDKAKGQGDADIVDVCKQKNAVVIMNGDFYKKATAKGYTVRQSVVYKDSAVNSEGILFDMLIIDSEGDLHPVYDATDEAIQAYVEENLTPNGRIVMDTLNFGPVLMVDGEVQNVKKSRVARHNLYEWQFPIMRIALVQTGHLEYAIVFTNGLGNRKSGLTMTEFADYVAEKCPGAILAYNLDGGGSANIAAHNERIHIRNKYIRSLCDFIYFASAESDEDD